MSIQKVNPNVWWAIKDQSLAQDIDATSEWHDVSAWTDKTIWYEGTGANPDFDIEVHISPEDYYTLNNKTADTDDYVVKAIVTAHGDQILTIVTAADTDMDFLQRPIHSMRVKIGNDSATTGVFNVKIMGWS